MYNVEATTVKEISRKIGDQRKIESYIQIRPSKVNFHFGMLLCFFFICLPLYDTIYYVFREGVETHPQVIQYWMLMTCVHQLEEVVAQF